MSEEERVRFQVLRGRELRDEELPEDERAELARGYEILDREETELLALFYARMDTKSAAREIEIAQLRETLAHLEARLAALAA